MIKKWAWKKSTHLIRISQLCYFIIYYSWMWRDRVYIYMALFEVINRLDEQAVILSVKLNNNNQDDGSARIITLLQFGNLWLENM